MNGSLTISPGVESRFNLEWYNVTDGIGALIAALKAGENVIDQAAIAHLPAIRSAVRGLWVTSRFDPTVKIDPLLRPGDKLIWARDHAEGSERWRIRRYPAIDGATADQARMFFMDMYQALISRAVVESERRELHG